jgi:hypothetical protein
MTNVMHKFLIYLSIYFCLTCFGLSFSPSSKAGVQYKQYSFIPKCTVLTTQKYFEVMVEDKTRNEMVSVLALVLMF